MSLLTIERSSSSDNLSQSGCDTDDDQIDAYPNEDVFTRSRTSSFEGFFASKGAAYAIPDGDFARKAAAKGGQLQSHLQGMVNLIRDEDVMRLVVKIETPMNYTRYLTIVTSYSLSDEEESILLGFDWLEENVTIGLIIPLWSDVAIALDGDGGFKVDTQFRHYVFKPVSVQTMWTALQWIHRCLASAHRGKHFSGGSSHAWLAYYENRISSPRECINYWESLDEITSKREENVSFFDKVKTDEELLKGLIKHKLKEILRRLDLDEVTCRQVRDILESEMNMSLRHLKGYVDEQMLNVVGQMDSASKITDHVFLGSEWNASNLEELNENRVGYILNVTKEVDNFFPGTFEYMNIRLHDLEEEDLLRHWGKTYRFLHKAKEKGCVTLVHCRRGISRSASTVVAFLMKEHNMSLHDAMKLVKSKRSIVQPNAGFWKQLIIYEGILKSSRHRHSSLFRRRSNSDTVNSRRSMKKIRERHKKKAAEGDHVDGTPAHAHTLPRMSIAQSTPPLNGEPCLSTTEENVCSEETSADPLLARTTETPEYAEVSDGESSGEDSASDSDREPLDRSKLRRTHSEPVMKTVEQVSPIMGRKPRAMTFYERNTGNDEEMYDFASSPKKISPECQEEQDAIFLTDEKESSETHLESEKTAETLSLKEGAPSSPSMEENQNDSLSKTVPQQPEIPLDDGFEYTNQTIPNADIEESAETRSEVALEGPPVENVLNEPVESRSSTTVHDRECTERPSDVLPSGRDVNGKSENAEHIEESSTSPRCPRPRSRSIGERLEDKLLGKQGKSESFEHVKKVDGRGRVRRRERKSKSDLQLPSSGFVKRHTQIIEEQMLYSMLKDSEKTLASSATSVVGNGAQMCESVASSRSENGCENNLERFSEKTSDTGKDLGSEVGSSNNSVKDSGNDQDDSEKCFEKNSENQENLLRPDSELENIVQAVNAEAKRDLQGQDDVSRLPFISQKEVSGDSAWEEDVCIDQMTWIDLTRHQGDVVKRKSAAFESASEERKLASAKAEPSDQKPKQPVGSGSNSDQSPGRPRAELGTDKDAAPEERTLEMHREKETDDNTESNFSLSIPKLDLDQLSGEVLSETPRPSYTLIVEDYREWEASSVRDRTRILESIIAKSGGSFPSPRSRKMKKGEEAEEEEKERKQEEEEEEEKDRPVVVQNVDEEVDRVSRNIVSQDDSFLCTEQDKMRARSSSCPVGKDLTESLNNDNFSGDEMVNILVDRFEGKNGDDQASNQFQAI